MVGVAHEDDPRLERDFLLHEAVGVAAAVPALVAVAHDDPHLLQAVDGRDDPLAEHRVHLDQRALGRAEPAGLEEDRARHADLADVVQQRAELELLERVLVEAELAAHAQ